MKGKLFFKLLSENNIHVFLTQFCCSLYKFVYSEGLASIEPTDFSHIAEQQIVTCLKTKWPGMWLEWNGKTVPSLN